MPRIQLATMVVLAAAFGTKAIGDSTTQRWDQDIVAACYGCHIGAKASKCVFSEYRH